MGTEEIPNILGEEGIAFKDVPIYNTLFKMIMHNI